MYWAVATLNLQALKKISTIKLSRKLIMCRKM